jgi:alkylation response protein AidB-like acyl-CoA dehydrogenase
LQNIEVKRLKQKLGTHALPTAELTLQGVRAVLVGPIGRGVATVATMLNVTRLYNALTASSYMHKAVTWAERYSWTRHAFGKPLAAHPLHALTLSQLRATTTAAMLLAFETASLLGRMETGIATETQQKRLRALVPIAKLLTAKQAVLVVSEVLESVGGAGYVEDTGLPRMLFSSDK